MVDGYYKAVRIGLEDAGFVFERNTKGSHEKWTNPQTGRSVIVPRNLYSRHTANGILKDAGIDRRF